MSGHSQLLMALVVAATLQCGAPAPSSEEVRLEREVGPLADAFAAGKAAAEAGQCGVDEARRQSGQFERGLPQMLAWVGRAWPPGLRLSRLSWEDSAETDPAALVMVFAEGDPSAAGALLKTLVAGGACGVTSLKQSPEGLKAYCLLTKGREPPQKWKALEPHAPRLLTLEQVAGDPAQPRRLVALFDRKLEHLAEQLPREARVDDLRRDLPGHPEQSGVTVTRIADGTPVASPPGLTAIPIEVEASGSFESLARFALRTQRHARISRIREATLRNPRARDGELVLDASFKLTAFALPAGTAVACSGPRAFATGADTADTPASVLFKLDGVQDPFAGKEPVLAGAAHAPTSCRKSVARLDFAALDELQVVDAKPGACARLIDLHGQCQIVRLGQRVGHRSVEHISARRVVLTSRGESPDLQVWSRSVQMAVAKGAAQSCAVAPAIEKE